MHSINIRGKDPVGVQENSFDPANDSAYGPWRTWKLAGYPQDVAELIVPVADAACLTPPEHDRLLACCAKSNLAIYRITDGDIRSKLTVRRLGEQFGLHRLDDNLCADEDSITSLQVVDEGRHTHYIPYTNRPLSWHTDGYYNAEANTIRAIVMHCVTDAAQGGDNLFYDHELAYLRLRDENPLYIKALMAADAMTIPPNVENGVEIRGAQRGPVFTVEKSSGNLHMRYSARQRNIVWKNDPLTLEAAAFLRELLVEGTPGVFRYRLRPGEGIVSNNVLHRREAFSDASDAGKSRLLYRARYYDRIAGTDIKCLFNARES